MGPESAKVRPLSDWVDNVFFESSDSRDGLPDAFRTVDGCLSSQRLSVETMVVDCAIGSITWRLGDEKKWNVSMIWLDSNWTRTYLSLGLTAGMIL